ncbi:DUF5937 family protein [Kribbella sp. NPDC006257]|uniref:DUF5937 family protein n=1 Tax=Kribbella sp. NPDC006257 TaxID=3156738 RepID=UPI0033A0C3E1
MALAAEDVARTRFVSSPVEEVIHSVRVISGINRNMLHRPWAAAVRPQLAGLNLELLRALVGNAQFLPDFLGPPPNRSAGGFTEELDAIRSTDPAMVIADLDELAARQSLSPLLRRFYDSPEQGLSRLVDEVRSYWQVAIEPYWARIRAVHDADIAHRMEQLTTGGFARVFADLHQEVEYAGDRLVIHKPQHQSSRVARGLGVVLIPCVFAWPQLIVLHQDPYQPTLTYPPRGVGEIWAGRQPAVEPMGALIGRSRAALLANLALPLSTSQLAKEVEMTLPAVSQQLAVLRQCRLITSRRSGRWILHQRTPLGTELLLAAADSGQIPSVRRRQYSQQAGEG